MASQLGHPAGHLLNVVLSLAIETASGKSLSEKMLVQTMAGELGIPFKKLAPLDPPPLSQARQSRQVEIRCSAASLKEARAILQGKGPDSQRVTLKPCHGQAPLIRQLGLTKSFTPQKKSRGSFLSFWTCAAALYYAFYSEDGYVFAFQLISLARSFFLQKR